MIDNKIKRRLGSIDWDFPSTIKGTTKLIHWYPGSFPALLPATFIQALSKPGDIIFDPYGGGGTTAAEAIRLGRRAWITDVNPVGILSSYVYASLMILRILSEDKFKLFFHHIRALLDSSNSSLNLDFNLAESDLKGIDREISAFLRPKPKIMLDMIRGGRAPETKKLEKWIHASTLEEIFQVHKNGQSSESHLVQIFFEAMLSSNLRVLSSQNQSWGHIADNVWPKSMVYKDSHAHLRKWLTSVEKSVLRCSIDRSAPLKGIQYWASIHNWNSDEAVKTRPRSKANLILTSPPYGDAIDYFYAQKLSLYFMGYSDDEVTYMCSQEIGARRKRNKANSRLRWAEELTSAALKQVGYLSGLLVTILPHKNHGREIGLNMMKEGLNDQGWVEVYTVDRSIDQKKTRQSWTSIKQETLCIFSKEPK